MQRLKPHAAMQSRQVAEAAAAMQSRMLPCKDKKGLTLSDEAQDKVAITYSPAFAVPSA